MTNENQIYKVKPVECPVCGKSLSSVHGINHIAEPQAYDISICGYCTTVMVFDKNINPKVITDEQIAILKTANSQLWNDIQETIENINKSKGNPVQFLLNKKSCLILKRPY